MKKIRLGIVGISNIGSTHVLTIQRGECPDFELTAVADINPERLTWAKETVGDSVRTFTTAEELFDSGLIDACIIAVPHYAHCRLAKACIERGIHVMVEKPVGVYTSEVRELNKVADEHPEVVFGVMFNQRTNPVYRKIKELIDSGKYGQIRRTNWIITNWYRSQAYYDSGDWRATWAGEGGGVLLNQSPHQLDLWQWLCGMPVKVHGHLLYGKWHDIEVEDDVTAYVEYANGATGVFITTTGDPFGTNRLEIQMDGAKIVAENDTLAVWEFEVSEPEFNRTNTAPFGRIKTNRLELETDGESTMHPGVIRAWGGAILRGEPLIADGREGICGLTLSNAMHLSSWTNQTVELPMDEDLFYAELIKRVATSRRKQNINAVVSNTADTYTGTNP